MVGRYAGVAQLVEQLIRNQQVSGSSPLAGSTKNFAQWIETGQPELPERSPPLSALRKATHP